MKVKKTVIFLVFEVIIVIYFAQCGIRPGQGTGKWGEMEKDIMRKATGGDYYEINTYPITREGRDCKDTNKRLEFISNDHLDYVAEIDNPRKYIKAHKTLSKKFYVAGVSKIKTNGYNSPPLLGATYWHSAFGVGSLIFVEKIEEYFDASVRWIGNGAIVAHELGHQFGFGHHPTSTGCFMDSVFSSSIPPSQFCISHRDSLKNLPTGSQLLAFKNNLISLFGTLQLPYSVKESLILYKDTVYEGEPLTFKVWIINKGNEPLKVFNFMSLIVEELFGGLDVSILIKDEKEVIRKIKPRVYIDRVFPKPISPCTVLPGDSIYYKFSKFIDLPPGKYWVKLETGFLWKSQKNDWVPFYIKKYHNKKEKEIAIPYLKGSVGFNISLIEKLKKKYKKEDKKGLNEIIYEKLRKENENSPYLPYILLTIIDEVIRIKSDVISYEEFKNSEYYKEFQRFQNFPYYEDLLWFEALFLFSKAGYTKDMSLIDIGIQKLEEAERIAPKYLYIKIWKEYAKILKDF